MTMQELRQKWSERRDALWQEIEDMDDGPAQEEAEERYALLVEFSLDLREAQS